MALSIVYWLADIEGAVCVAARATDWNEPRYVVNYWPTKIRTRDLCSAYDVDDAKLGESFTVAQAIPGLYICRPAVELAFALWRRNFELSLTEGAKTRPVKTETQPVPRPRAGKASVVEWDSGRWVGTTPKGPRRIVDVSAYPAFRLNKNG